MEKVKQTNNDVQNTTQRTKDRAPHVAPVTSEKLISYKNLFASVKLSTLSCHDIIRPILSCSLFSWCDFEAIGQHQEKYDTKNTNMNADFRRTTDFKPKPFFLTQLTIFF